MGIINSKRVTGKLALGAAAAMAFAMPGTALAADVVGDFGGPGFAYGTGTGATGFTATPFQGNNCFGVTLSCYGAGSNAVPTIAQNVSGSTQNFQTVSVPNNFLVMHPGNSAPGTDSVLRFTAATAGLYKVAGLFQRLDVTPGAGTGVIASLLHTTTLGNTKVDFTTTILPTDFAQKAFTATFGLLAGDSLYFVVNNNGGDFRFDSTGLQASITPVPELGTWAMMLLGIGMIGGAARYRRRSTRVVFG